MSSHQYEVIECRAEKRGTQLFFPSTSRPALAHHCRGQKGGVQLETIESKHGSP